MLASLFAMLFLIIYAGVVLLGLCDSEKVKQCQCKEIDNCLDKFDAQQALEFCMDQCQQHITGLGANYQQVKQCVKDRQGLITASVSCIQQQHANACAKEPTNKMVEKRYMENLQLAAMTEINSMIKKMGLAGNETKKLVHVGKELFGCVRPCMMAKAGNCESKLKCGLALPKDAVIVMKAKECAMNNGFDTSNAKQLCECISKAGVKELHEICPRLVIS